MTIAQFTKQSPKLGFFAAMISRLIRPPQGSLRIRPAHRRPYMRKIAPTNELAQYHPRRAAPESLNQIGAAKPLETLNSSTGERH